MQSYVINFIRHGMTEANIKGQYVGITDIPVCDEGIEKLKNLKEKFVYPEVKAYYSSPLMRCVQTCGIIYPGVDPVIVDGLRECDFGDWEGKTTFELKDNEEYKNWIRSGQRLQPPNGESGEEFKKRLCLAVEKIVEDIMKSGITSVAVFAHGGVIMAILSIYGLSDLKYSDFIVANGCGYSVRVTPGLWMRDKVFEICQKIPFGHNETISGEFKKIIDEQKNFEN